MKELKGTIDAVVNVAGVVDFNPPLDEALDTNAFGAQNLVALAKALGDAPLMHTSTCYVVGNRDGLILEEKPGERFPFPRAEELGRDLWSPERRDRRLPRPHRAGEEPLRGRVPPERVPRARDEEPRAPWRADRGRPARGRAEERQAQVRERPPRRGRPRARHALGLAEHLHVHEEHRRADHRAARASRSPSRGPRAARARSSSPSPAGTRASARPRRSSSSR